MTEWWTHGYPGGPLVPVAGFPRALYPPDAAPGRTPSTDGPDIEAMKRTISRAGRWPWQKFDRAYSNAFAHGRSDQVPESGVAGTQRQGNIEPDSGWIGETTFNLFRSIRIPEGLPHAGEPAMDANAQTLIAEAYAQFQPPPPAPRLVRELALAEAEKYIGVTESPAGSNMNQFGAWYGNGFNGSPWCAIFVTFCYETCCKTGSPSFTKGVNYAYVPYMVSDAQNKRNGLTVTSSPIAGDAIAYDWDGGDYDHVELFESGNSSSWSAIGGNTSTSDNSNGGQVMRRARKRSEAAKVTFIRIAEP